MLFCARKVLNENMYILIGFSIMKITHRYVYMLVHIVHTTIHNSEQTNDNLFEHKNLKIRARTLMEFQSSKYSEVPNKSVMSYILLFTLFRLHSGCSNTGFGELRGVPGLLALLEPPPPTVKNDIVTLRCGGCCIRIQKVCQTSAIK